MNTLDVVKTLFPVDVRSKIWIVGGTVRDLLMGREGDDIDLDAALTPDELVAYGFRPVDPVTSAPIWFRFIPDVGKIEITRLNNPDELTRDIFRRDFTVNALALTLDGELVDLVNGRQDVVQKILRTCTSDSLQDDPLRIFRAFRFETEGWHLAPEAEELISARSWENELTRIPTERFSREMLKALKGAKPVNFFRSMIRFGVGNTYLPELFRMPVIPAGPRDKHPEGDLFTHACEVLERVSMLTSDPLTRFCAFFHDLGKLATSPELYPRHHGHEDAGFDLAREFCNRLCLSATHRSALMWICRLHGNAGHWQELRDATKIRIADQARRAGIVEILPLIAAGDKPEGRDMPRWTDAVRAVGMSTQQLGIERERLEAMPVDKRADYVLQKRIEWLRQGGISG